MIRFLRKFLIAGVFILACMGSAWAYDVCVDGIYYDLVTKAKQAIVVKGDKDYVGDVTIPETIIVDGVEYEVTQIGNEGFNQCELITSISLPESLTSIGNKAFYRCSGLTSIILPKNLTTIGVDGFSQCSNLITINLPENLVSIGSFGFYGCSNLTTVVFLGDKLHSIESSSFAHCVNLTSIKLPSELQIIKINAFSGCSKLTSINLPPSLLSIESLAFKNCSSLLSIYLPNSLQSIGYEAFSNCVNLASITFLETLLSIEFSAFANCTSLKSLVFPENLSYIRYDAFTNCTNLSTIRFQGQTEIGANTFANCKNLESVYCYSESVPTCASDAFENSLPEYATLYVPASAVAAYSAASPWNTFGTIKTLEGEEPSQCEAPSIAFEDGKLKFTCGTPGAEFYYAVKSDDMTSESHAAAGEAELAGCYEVSAYATAEGYKKSDTSTASLYWVEPKQEIMTDLISIEHKRGVLASSANGIITLSGLTDGEPVSFYTLKGVELGSTTAANGVANFAASAGSIVIARIGNTSIKIQVR